MGSIIEEPRSTFGRIADSLGCRLYPLGEVSLRSVGLMLKHLVLCQSEGVFNVNHVHALDTTEATSGVFAE